MLTIIPIEVILKIPRIQEFLQVRASFKTNDYLSLFKKDYLIYYLLFYFI